MTNKRPTLKFEAVFGLIPGYNHNNQPELAFSVDDVAREWKKAMDVEMESTGRMISAVIIPSRVVYKGCPDGGEFVVTITGAANPKFVPHDELPFWKISVLRVIRNVRIALGQARLFVGFCEVTESVYIEPDIETQF